MIFYQLYNAQSNVENVAADVNYCFEKIERHKNEANLNLIKNFQRSQEDFQLVKESIKTTADELIEQSYHWTDFDYTEFTNYIKIIVKKIDENFKDFTTQWITTNANEIYKNMLKDLKSITNKEVLRITKAFNEKQNANFSCWTSKVDEFCALIEYKSYKLLPSVDDKNPIAGFNLKESVLQTYQACIGNQEAGRCIKNNVRTSIYLRIFNKFISNLFHFRFN